MTQSAARVVETTPGDELFDAFCAVWADSERHDRPTDPPRPASDHVALGRALVEPGGSRDGTHRDPRRARQAGTLVRSEHRGHRLGALIKVAVLRELTRPDLGVRRISTTNTETNLAMVAVNDALGFVPAGRRSTWSHQIQATALASAQ